jgi:hypothetical protein
VKPVIGKKHFFGQQRTVGDKCINQKIFEKQDLCQQSPHSRRSDRNYSLSHLTISQEVICEVF